MIVQWSPVFRVCLENETGVVLKDGWSLVRGPFTWTCEGKGFTNKWSQKKRAGLLSFRRSTVSCTIVQEVHCTVVQDVHCTVQEVHWLLYCCLEGPQYTVQLFSGTCLRTPERPNST